MALVYGEAEYPQSVFDLFGTVPITDIMSNGVVSNPSTVVMACYVVGTGELIPFAGTLQMAPSGTFAQPDSNGNVGVGANFGPYITDIFTLYSHTGRFPGTTSTPNGFWALSASGFLTGYTGKTIGFSISAMGDAPADHPVTGSPPDPVTDVTITETSYNPETERQSVSVSWTNGVSPGVGTYVIINGPGIEPGIVISAVPPGSTGVTNVRIPVLPPGAYTIIVQPYLTPPGNIAPPATTSLIIPSAIMLPVIGALTIDLALSPTMQFIGDPSGIYTLVVGKTNDTLYERIPAARTSQIVKIPRPFGKTSFTPEG